jgi:pyridoxal phosphate enzyme (YggS family)
MIEPDQLRANYESVRERIWSAAARSGRAPDSVTLVAVTKTWPAELVVMAYEAGMRHFGENRPEELAAKRPVVETMLGQDAGIHWHLIGTLQSRKTRLAADYADRFHALDRDKIVRRLSADLVENGRRLVTFLEVNISGESTKAGFDCREWEANATEREALRTMFVSAAEMPGLDMAGLMTMAPWDIAPDIIRSVFRRSRLLNDWLQSQLPAGPPLQLSMGMTDDFEIAIEEGATHIRVGRALFGERGG